MAPRTPDGRRKGDERPRRHRPGVDLTLTPAHGEPFRWLPRHGEPSCIGEWVTQQAIRWLAWLPLYTALIATLVLLVLVFDIPYLES
jgi:hypothetical protein